MGNSAGVIAMVYNGVNSTIGYYRGKHDTANSIVAGALSGMVFKSTRGPRQMAISGALVASAAGAWAVSFLPITTTIMAITDYFVVHAQACFLSVSSLYNILRLRPFAPYISVSAERRQKIEGMCIARRGGMNYGLSRPLYTLLGFHVDEQLACQDVPLSKSQRIKLPNPCI